MLETLLYMIQQYNPDANLDLVIRAYNYANQMHEGQYRRSGEKYITHPLEVAKILAHLELDVETIAAGLMHDVVEDTAMTREQMVSVFGEGIASLVEGVTKLGKMDYESKAENQTENLRKMFMAMAKDVRVVLIKLSDRLHNARTFKYMKPYKAQEKSKETLEIFAPIARRLGISKIQWEMEDIAIRYLEPLFYFDTQRSIEIRIKERDKYINEVIENLSKKIEDTGIKHEIYGREKHIYSIYKKMQNKKLSFDEIYDFIAVRVLVDSVGDCYSVLGTVHSLWKPLAGRIKDYIANPKSNMYQSLHTTILGPDGLPVEVQIRTYDMHRTAEYGIAAHWKYKDGRIDQEETEMDKKLSWLRQMMDWQQEILDPDEFMDSLKVELFANQVFVQTPKGDIIDLPAGSTPLDMAYKIHSGVGNACIGAKIGGRMIPLDTKLESGDVVEIITSPNSKGPSRDWLNIVKSGHAKNKIRQWFKKERREENIEKGREVLEKDAKRVPYKTDEFLTQKALQTIARQYHHATVEDLYAAIGYGGLTINQVINKLKLIYEIEHEDEIRQQRIERLKTNQETETNKNIKTNVKSGSQPVNVKNVDNILTRLAKCCTPIPGDEIIGYITKGAGVSVHRTDCVNVKNLEPEKLIEVSWNRAMKGDNSFDVQLKIEAYNRSGLLSDLSRIFEDEKVKILGINARSEKSDIASTVLSFEVASKEQLKAIIRKIKNVADVQDVYRISG